MLIDTNFKFTNKKKHILFRSIEISMYLFDGI